MSLFPIKPADLQRMEEQGSTSQERQALLVGSHHRQKVISVEGDDLLATLIYDLFTQNHHPSHQHPRSSPPLPPERRGKRHRNYYIYQLNQFRHWWKTSRLLVRLSGATVFCENLVNWEGMALVDVTRVRGGRHAVKFVQHIGRGGPMKIWLQQVHPFTRTVRIILGVARGWEARVDNRLYEVGIAEAFAFMGNRCFRYWARHLADWLAAHVAFPLLGVVVAPYLDPNARPVIVAMGFLRGVLPFAASFQGSRFGRQLTFKTYKYANYRWKPVQSIMQFHEQSGAYQDTNLDPELLAFARAAAEAIGHGQDPVETRKNLAAIGFDVFASGYGGHAVYRRARYGKLITMHVTPYGPAILGELPMFIILERRREFYVNFLGDQSDGTIFDAATPREANVQGFTYSGAFFQSQEWARLKQRYDRELANYANACRLMGTRVLPAKNRNTQETKIATPPMDLQSLKAFLRTGHPPKKQRKDKTQWRKIQRQVNKMAKLVAKYQQQNKAPSRVILYLEGLDCVGKSSTGGLICHALEQCGYTVNIAQHNRPPTPEQRQKPWMDRGRFEYPDDLFEQGTDDIPDYASLVWDRGPVGDFVYGNLNQLPVDEKLKRYEEFRRYDYNCRRESVLFCKVFFVADKDSIAKTLGKRLAHKKIARELRAWLDANSVEQFHEGLEAIEAHIDPSDFAAYNRYEKNLALFTEVVRNTDYGGLVDKDPDSIGYNNPWLVVNTSDRFKARIGIMQAFQSQLKRFATKPYDRVDAFDRLACFFSRETVVQPVSEPVPSDIVEQKEHGLSCRALVQAMVLALLLGAYIHQTWKIDIEDIT